MGNISAFTCLVEYPDAAFLTRIFNESTGYEYNFAAGDWAGIPGGGYHFEFLGTDLTKYASATIQRPFDPETHTNAPDTVTLEGMIQHHQSGAGCHLRFGDVAARR